MLSVVIAATTLAFAPAAPNQDATTHYHFDRVSDSRDTTGSGT